MAPPPLLFVNMYICIGIEPCLLVYTKALKGNVDFQKQYITTVNRYIELRNPFLRIRQSILSDCKLFPRFQNCKCNPRKRIVYFDGKNYQSMGTKYYSVRTDCTMRYHDLPLLFFFTIYMSLHGFRICEIDQPPRPL